jgi:acetoin utilization deacetylase AcuC-like enzyme
LKTYRNDRISRRDFIHTAASAGVGLLLAGCGGGDAPEAKASAVTEDKKGAGGKGTVFFYHPDCLKHDTGRGHPEKPGRLTAILDQLRKYIDLAKREIEAGRRKLSTGDAIISKDSWNAALLAAGASIQAVDRVAEGRAANAFCAIRPPGHHARPKKGGMGVLIVDWDVHHGNGTQDTFWTDGTVMNFHTQQKGIYPGTGHENERGEGRGEGMIINVPLAAGAGNDVFTRVYREHLVPAARRFEPEMILLSAGYDSHKDDPLGDLALDEAGYAALTDILLELADELCKGRLVVCLEGGYNLQALGRSASATMRRMRAVAGSAAASQSLAPSDVPLCLARCPSCRPGGSGASLAAIIGMTPVITGAPVRWFSEREEIARAAQPGSCVRKGGNREVDREHQAC